jgi:hypothetical protein
VSVLSDDQFLRSRQANGTAKNQAPSNNEAMLIIIKW